MQTAQTRLFLTALTNVVHPDLTKESRPLVYKSKYKQVNLEEVLRATLHGGSSSQANMIDVLAAAFRHNGFLPPLLRHDFTISNSIDIIPSSSNRVLYHTLNAN